MLPTAQNRNWASKESDSGFRIFGFGCTKPDGALVFQHGGCESRGSCMCVSSRMKFVAPGRTKMLDGLRTDTGRIDSMFVARDLYW